MNSRKPNVNTLNHSIFMTDICIIRKSLYDCLEARFKVNVCLKSIYFKESSGQGLFCNFSVYNDINDYIHAWQSKHSEQFKLCLLYTTPEQSLTLITLKINRNEIGLRKFCSCCTYWRANGVPCRFFSLHNNDTL